MLHFASLPCTLQKFFHYWSQRNTVIMALEMAGLWGPTLTVCLHMDILLQGKAPAFFFAKTLLTSTVLYLVASCSYACAAMGGEAG